MKYLLLILVIVLSSGCSLGRLSKTEGSASFSLPFDFPYHQRKEDAFKYEDRQEMMREEMIRLEAEMIEGKVSSKSEQLN